MTRIEVDAAELVVAARSLDACVQVMQQVRDDARRLVGGGADYGHGGLAGATQEFLDRWTHGMAVLAEDGFGLARLLEQAAVCYRQVDGEIAAAAAAGGDR